jgi:hypothetical protein
MSEEFKLGHIPSVSPEAIKPSYEQVAEVLEQYDNGANVQDTEAHLRKLLKQYPQLGSDSILFSRISRDSMLRHLVSYADPITRELLKETIPQSAEEALNVIGGLQLENKGEVVINGPQIIKAYLDMFPELKNNYDLFNRLAANRHYDYLLEYASDEVKERLGKMELS